MFLLLSSTLSSSIPDFFSSPWSISPFSSFPAEYPSFSEIEVLEFDLEFDLDLDR